MKDTVIDYYVIFLSVIVYGFGMQRVIKYEQGFYQKLKRKLWRGSMGYKRHFSYVGKLNNSCIFMGIQL